MYVTGTQDYFEYIKKPMDLSTIKRKLGSDWCNVCHWRAGLLWVYKEADGPVYDKAQARFWLVECMSHAQDYFEYINKLMDLSTIKRKLDSDWWNVCHMRAGLLWVYKEADGPVYDQAQARLWPLLGALAVHRGCDADVWERLALQPQVIQGSPLLHKGNPPSDEDDTLP